MRRRGFLALLGSSAMAWPLAARARHQGVRRIGMLYSLAENDPESTVRRAAFEQALKDLGWTNGSNLRIGYRWAQNDPELIRKFVAELISHGWVSCAMRREVPESANYQPELPQFLPAGRHIFQLVARHSSHPRVPELFE